MPPAGQSRREVALALRAAYGEGLLSQRTLAHRLELLFGSVVVDPAAVIGDLAVRARAGRLARTVAGVRALRGARGARRGRWDRRGRRAGEGVLLALDWSGAQDELLVGRHRDCDVVVDEPTVSRRHARLSFRDGSWVLRDLESTNGTCVNGSPVVRCRLLPGDRVALGDAVLVVD